MKDYRFEPKTLPEPLFSRTTAPEPFYQAAPRSAERRPGIFRRGRSNSAGTQKRARTRRAA